MKRCPVRSITQQSFILIDAFRCFKSYGLPYPSLGWPEHPAKLLDAFDVIEAMLQELGEAKNGKH